MSIIITYSTTFVGFVAFLTMMFTVLASVAWTALPMQQVLDFLFYLVDGLQGCSVPRK